MDKQEKKGIAIGAIIGAVIGVITGILFAPKSGKETRKDIKDAAGKAADGLLKEARKLQDETKELLEHAEEKIKSLTGKASETVKSHVNEVKKQRDNVKVVVSAFRSGSATDKDLDKAVKQAKIAQKALKEFLTK